MALLKLYAVQYLKDNQQAWHSIQAYTPTDAENFVSEYYSDVYGNKAAILQSIEIQPTQGLKYGIVPPEELKTCKDCRLFHTSSCMITVSQICMYFQRKEN